ncbi:hypothetical protein CRYUN_Cryun29cG0049200 [Craigia yunnanensis]
MDTGASGSSSKINRSSVERERRMRLKDLFSKLSSVLPPQPTKMSTHEVLEHATVYVNQLQNQVEELKKTKLQGGKREFKLCDIIKILMEEGAEVITASANHSTWDRIICSIHCQPIISRIGIATSRVKERLEDLIS